MALEISYPFKPYIITQHWGNPNPSYATQFNDPLWTAHNGIDAINGKFDWNGNIKTEYPVYAPVDGFKVTYIGWQPNGGGNEMFLESIEPIQVGDKLCTARIYLCHAKKILVSVGDTPALGELIMIADNTGFSTGLHTHMGLYRLDGNHLLDPEGNAHYSIDPEPFFNQKYAVDQATLPTLIKSNVRFYQYKLTGI